MKLENGNISVIFPFHGFIAGTVLFLLWFVSSTLCLFLNRSDAWNDDIPVLSQALQLLELSIAKLLNVQVDKLLYCQIWMFKK